MPSFDERGFGIVAVLIVVRSAFVAEGTGKGGCANVRSMQMMPDGARLRKLFAHEGQFLRAFDATC